MNAPVFLDTRVLNHAMEGRINAVRADKTLHVPVVMTRAAFTSAGVTPYCSSSLFGLRRSSVECLP